MEGEASNRKRGRGRQKIPMQKIADKDSLFATFTKRRKGIFKKASELSLDSNVNVGIIINSPADVPHSFMAPDLGAVAQFSKISVNEGDAAWLSNTSKTSQIVPLCKQVEGLEERKQVVVQHGLRLMAKANMVIPPDSCWEKPVKDLDYYEAKNMVTWLACALFQMKKRANYLESLNSRVGL